MEIKYLVEDSMCQPFGRIKTGLLLWESCVIPFLINNAGSWLGMKKSDIDCLTKLQHYFFSQILAIQNCPAHAMTWDLGCLSMHLRILKEKLSLYHHIVCLPENALARQVLEIQEKFNFPGLREEIQPFLAKYNLTDVKSFSKGEWKKMIKKYIFEENASFLLNEMKKYKKNEVESFALEEFGLKKYFSYLNLEQARIKFRERMKCMVTCKTHFPSEPQFIKDMLQCPEPECSKIDVLDHWKFCSAYDYLKQGRNFSRDVDLIEFYRAVISHREAQL